MRILLLSQWYPPEPQKVVSDIAVQLRESGHDVTVLTGYPNFPEGKLYADYRMKVVMKEELDGIQVIRVPLYPDHSRSVLKRSLNLLTFCTSAALIGPFVTPKVDVIYVTQPLTSFFASLFVSRLGRIPTTFEVQDIWPETLHAAGFINNRWLLATVGRLMQLVYRSVDEIRVISSGFADNLKAKGVPEDKIWMIPNWVDSQWYRPTPADPELARLLGLQGKFNVMFAGTMGVSQGLQTVLDTAEQLRETTQIQFLLVGGGSQRESLEQEAERRGLTNVRFLGPYSQEEIVSVQGAADVLLVHLRDDPLFRITIPHKTLSYMACGKPVLVAVNGIAAQVVESVRAGITCPADSPLEMARAVMELYRMPESERQEMGVRGREAAISQYSRERLVGQIGKMLESAVQRRAKRRNRTTEVNQS